MRAISVLVLVAGLTTSAAAVAAENRLPAGFCAVDTAGSEPGRRLARIFGPPATVNATLQRLAIDCDSLRAAEAGGEEPPKRVFTELRSRGDDGLPHERAAYLDEMERRFAGPDLLARDDRAIYLAERPAGDGRAFDMSGANAYTMIDGRPAMLNVYVFTPGDEVATAYATIREALRLLDAP